MFRTAKIFVGLLMGALVAEQASAFTMWGPYESWQTGTLNYTADTAGGPKNYGEEWRMNTPIITYGFDYSFLNYYGADGMKAVDAAFRIMNSLPPVSKMSRDLSEYPTVGNLRINQRAQALGLLDLKSFMLQILVEHLGLSGERHVFDLYSRTLVTAPCTFQYVVLNWNWDPVTYEPTHYVNGVHYTYEIVDNCPTALADAVEYPVDREALTGTTVADLYTLIGYGGGGYYNGLTRDDVGGLRYLYRRNNYNLEALPPDAIASTPVSSTPWSIPNFSNTNNNTGGNGGTGTTNNGLLLRGGIEKVTFVKMQAQSLVSTTFRPTLINYTVPAVVNSKLVDQKVRRLVTTPDILITAANGGTDWAFSTSHGQVAANTSTNGSAGTLGGPGVFLPQMTVTFNNLGGYDSVSGDSTAFYLTEADTLNGRQWASFDGTTNAPIVYPKGSSIRAIEDRVLTSPLDLTPSMMGTPITFSPVYTGTTTNSTGNNNNPGGNNQGGR